MKDIVRVDDALFLNNQPARSLKSIWDEGKEPVEIKGFFSAQLRERGKKVYNGERSGFNIWTLTGREYLAQLMSLQSLGVPYRTDHIFYIGFGRGSQAEVASVARLFNPIAYDADGNYLAQLSFPTFPLSPTRTTVRYARSYSELQLSITGTVPLTEAGLYSDGNPDADPAWRTRIGPDDLRLSAARLQPPMAYKSFEVLKKTQNFVLEVAWEVRF